MVIEVGTLAPAQNNFSARSPERTPQVQQNFSQADSVVRSDETFFSPVIRIDVENQAAILQFRDTETGEVQREYSSNSVRVYEESGREEPVERVETESVEAEGSASESESQDIVV